MERLTRFLEKKMSFAAGYSLVSQTQGSYIVQSSNQENKFLQTDIEKIR